MIETRDRDNVTCIKGTIIKDGYKGRPVYVFLADGMLIDTGAKHLEEDLIPYYENHSIDFVALTHSHEDHTGTASWLQENQNLPIYIHPKGIGTCRENCPYPKYRQHAWGVRKPFEARAMNRILHSRHHEWKVIDTPGHAHDHVSLLNEKTGRLFSGDLFVSPKTKVIMDSESIPVTMESIRKILAYDFESMFCCHAGYIPNGQEMLKQKLDYLENVSEDAKQLYHEGFSVAEINQKLFPKKYPITEISGGEWDSVHIVSSILSD
ncbi:MBL fold metallo-hydrolase [Lentibacillus jeotgali]|uniref:MBL fold metallo-hydrolase n=1 Tax=Lentibacillus jeotgali TaxID=558169 RepID=UPI0002628F84|nr:MBL fold metallo-hydrolase [Lentibacillus jeotgali]